MQTRPTRSSTSRPRGRRRNASRRWCIPPAILREPDAEDAPPTEVRSAGWAGIVLYGDPTPTILQRLSPSDAIGARGNQTAETERPAAAGVGSRAFDSV